MKVTNRPRTRVSAAGPAPTIGFRTRTQKAGTALALVVAVALGSCGVPIDDSPRAISRTTLDPDVDEARQTPTTSNSPGARQVAVFFMKNETLTSTNFPVDGTPTIGEALAFATSEPPPGFSTSIPSGTAILSAEVVDGVAKIDLTPDINDISGQTQKQAYAQLVFTAFAFEDLDAVKFEVDGKAVDAPTDNGNRASVTEGDYLALRPPGA